jgi:hypothetical protein
MALAPALCTAAPRIAAAGDIACPPSHRAFNRGVGTESKCQQRETARLLYHSWLDAILPIGDLVEPDPTLRNFRGVYASTWGRLKGRTYPAIGNHEYGLHNARGYFDYFNGVGRNTGRAGPRRRGWYSYDLGRWHLIALNGNCGHIRCGNRSRQVVWLRRNLRKHPNRCVLAYWHQPLFSSGEQGHEEQVRPLWRALHAAGADVVLNAHDHLYERFAPQTPGGRPDRKRGIVQFTVGTGGRSQFQFTHRARNSRRRIANRFGILRMRLGRGRYRWRFVDARRRTLDHGSRRCTPIGPALRQPQKDREPDGGGPRSM